MTLFSRIRRALQPTPLLPNITADQYARDRRAEGFEVHHKDGDAKNNHTNNIELRPVVHRSVGRLIQIGPHKLEVVAEDFESIRIAETAASRLQEILRTEHTAYPGMTVAEILDATADRICTELELDPERPYGRCFVAHLL